MYLVYKAPDDHTLIFDPTPEQMASIFRDSGDDYWLAGGNGEVSINVCLSPGDTASSNASLIRPDGITITYATGQPSLWIKRPFTGRFFFTYDGDAGWIVPYNGESCSGFIMDERGGDPFKIPEACLVDVESALEITYHFLRTQERSPAVPWALWNDLPLPDDWYAEFL